SANILTLPRISESLAGRMDILTLYPFSQGELSNEREGFIDWAFEDRQLKRDLKFEGRSEIWQKIIDGGYPEIQQREDPTRKEAWFRNYITTILERDVRALANISDITLMPRLLQLLASRITSLLNFAELSRSMQIPQTSLKRYLSLFEATYLIQKISPWSGNLGKRLVKAPKIYFTDVGLAANLLGANIDWIQQHPEQAGLLLENFVLTELRKQAAWNRNQVEFYYLRTQAGQEVDIILKDRQQQYLGIEIKAAHTVRPEDFRGLQWFANQMGERFVTGIVLYLGESPVAFGEKLIALPVSAIWHTLFNDQNG
ncbi:ATP-binding protein, partial [bacterium]|nr:ATP-binding protein [bacterium]